MTLLALESSCDETSAAVVRDGRILSCAVSSQIKLHAEYGGVVPELAAREHLRNLMPVVRTALREAGVTPEQLDAVAATRGPGLPLALLIGLKAAESFAFALQKPFIGINHHEAHLYSPWISGNPPAVDFKAFQPSLSLIVSGGHTMLVRVDSLLKHHVLGSTVDDAAGECFDKTGKLMGLPYPAGPEIDRLAEQGNPRAYDFPRPMINDSGDNFSFSGLKTSVRYFLRDHPALPDDPKKLRDLCASVQEAIVDVLEAKAFRAAERIGVHCITVSGGVSCNNRLRYRFKLSGELANCEVRFAEKSFCTDNAAMVGVLAEYKLAHGVAGDSLDVDIKPGWELA